MAALLWLQKARPAWLAPLLALILVLFVIGGLVGAGLGGAAGRAASVGLTALLVGALGLGAYVGWLILAALPANGFGMCHGRSQKTGHPALMEWVHSAIQDIAFGNPNHEPPLTFGDLIGLDHEQPMIDLKMITTNMSAGRPHTLPDLAFKAGFSLEEWRKRFPDPIMKYLEKVCGRWDSDIPARQLPSPEALPVIVAVRMSLSFPVLFSAVPLLGQRTGGAGGSTQDAAGDEAEADPVTTALRDGATRTRSAKAAGGNIPIWLTDGGISSNFPIHMFDAPLPGRPTFAVSLDELGKGLAPPANRVWLPTNARQGLYLPTKRIDTLGDFAGGVLNAAKDWQDQLLSAMPGQRERIAHVVLKSTEGGLNLAMPKKVAQELMLYGFQAGRLFVQDFDFDEHRWRRALVYYDQLSQAVKASEIQWNAGYSTFLRNHQPLSYADVTAAERRTIADSITAFTGLAWYIRPIINQARKFPKPKGQLRITPKF